MISRTSSTPGVRRILLGAGIAAVGLGAALAGTGTAAADSGAATTDASNTSRASASSPSAARSTRVAARSRQAAPASAARQATAKPAAGGGSPRARYTVANPLPPRQQWLANGGYCGEESFVSAGLYYGQYVSQYDARALASNNAPQNTRRSWLLLGVNDVATAKAMHLTSSAFDTTAQTDTTSFLRWVKGNVAEGYPVVIAVYNNEYLMYGRRTPTAGDPIYDHIVTVTGVTSSSPLTAPIAYSPDDVITFSDHGVWTGTPSGLPQYLFSYTFGAFPATRRQANARGGPVYSLPSTAGNYGIAITGVADVNHETVPVRLTTSVNAENPPMRNGTTRPTASPVTLTVTVSGLTPGATYNLYRYNSMAAVPDGSFNANAARAAQTWQIVATGPTYTLQQTILSSDVAVYRAVPASAG